VFPHVRLWTQNHADVIVFNSVERAAGDFDAPGDDRPEQAHFFLAACSQSPMRDARAFAWSPVSGNVLRDRERHIGLLESELAKKDGWLRREQEAQAALEESLDELEEELERSNEWAGQLNTELVQAGGAIARLQEELAATQAGYAEKVRQLEADLDVRLEWVHKLDSQIEGLERELIERTQWALSLQGELAHSEAQLRLAASSKWVRLGRRLNLGPEIVTGSGQPE